MQILGTIIHGALGDCYEQLCAIKLLKLTMPDTKWIGFFAVSERMDAMVHFKLDMLDEVYKIDVIESVHVDKYFQFQIKDAELNDEVLNRLSNKLRIKFDFKNNILPWHVLRTIDYENGGIKLELSEIGKTYLPICCDLNNVSDEVFNSKFTVGFLWRYRVKGGAVNPLFQRSKEWILKTKSELFNELIDKHNAHIIVAGMDKGSAQTNEITNAQKVAGVVSGEYNSKYTNDTLEILSDNVCYLKGLGYAAELEIMSRCNLLLLMPSGFSEPLWMKHSEKVVLIDPPPVYMAKLWRNNMPFFNNNKLYYRWFNTFTPHTKSNVLKFLYKNSLLPTYTD